MSVLDAGYQKKLEELLEKEIKILAANAVARIDVATEVGKKIAEFVENRIKVAALPEGLISHRAINWQGFEPTETILKNKSLGNFTSSGIQDAATEIELTLADQVVVVENTLVSRNIDVQESLKSNTATIASLKITDKLILNESINQQFKSMITDRFVELNKDKKIDIVNSAIYSNDKEVLTDSALGPSVANSNLRKLGRLIELNVSGRAEISDTMIVDPNGKVGINTTEPEGALTIWDDDSDLTIRRQKKKTTYVGTMRDCDLALGTNGDIQLTVKQNGTVEVKSIEISGLRISVSDKIPDYSGKPGELVIMSAAKENEPWAYRCLGNDRWKALDR